MDATLLILLAIGLSLTMAGAWAIQRVTGMSGWIDTVWSAAVGLFGLVAVIFADGNDARRLVAGLLIFGWSARLGLHIAGRTRLGGEDPRYAKLIEDWGSAASFRLFLFLQVQALAAFILVLAVYLAGANADPFGITDVLGIIIALIALGGEALADHQLSRFREQPHAKGAVCEVGLWRYSRHPNYFFEWLGWCAWPFLALSVDNGFSLLSLLAPILMYWLLVHVSGIPPLEEHMLRSRGDAFRALQKRVNAFFPGPRKQGDPV